MTDKPDNGKPASRGGDKTRDERRAQALRDNLRRRKAQAREADAVDWEESS